MQTETTYALSDAQVLSFETEGVLCPVPVLGPEETQSLLEVVRPADGQRLSALTRIKPHLLLPALWDIVHDPRILDPVQSLLGPDIYCIGSSTIEKAPGTDDYVAWHQDATFWGMEDARGVTAWLALTPATSLSGCMLAVPGTHQRQLPHRDTKDDLNMLGGREEVSELPDMSLARALELAPGEMSLHHPLVLHGSDPNRSDHDRIGFVMRFFPARTAQRGGGSVTLVRGRNLAGMELEAAPDETGRRDQLARHAEMMRRQSALLRREKEAHLKQNEPRS